VRRVIRIVVACSDSLHVCAFCAKAATAPEGEAGPRLLCFTPWMDALTTTFADVIDVPGG